MLLRCYSLSPNARLVETGGRSYLVSSHPLQQFELNASAARLVAALRPGVPLEEVASPIPAGTVGYLEEKVSQGLLRADYRVSPPREFPEVEVIVPVWDNPSGLARCLAALSKLKYPPDKLRVTVVDDGSEIPAQRATSGDVPQTLVLRWLRLVHNGGPASARNAALQAPWPGARLPAPLCAFVDSDCVPSPDWLADLVGVLEDSNLAAVGGRVLGFRRDSLLARYEAECSSLNLGSDGER